MKKILHLINNDNDGIYHYVKKLININLNSYDNLILSKYSRSSNIIKLDSGKSLKEFFNKQIDVDADLWFIEIVSKEVDLTDLFLKQGL